MSSPAADAARAAHARELRCYARRLRDQRFRSVEQYLDQNAEMAREMEKRADELVHPAAMASEPRPTLLVRSGRQTIGKRGRIVTVEVLRKSPQRVLQQIDAQFARTTAIAITKGQRF
jgi:hypothetical protein